MNRLRQIRRRLHDFFGTRPRISFGRPDSGNLAGFSVKSIHYGQWRAPLVQTLRPLDTAIFTILGGGLERILGLSLPAPIPFSAKETLMSIKRRLQPVPLCGDSRQCNVPGLGATADRGEANAGTDRGCAGRPADHGRHVRNGLRYYIRANKKPEKRAELRLVVKAGSILEEDDRQGLAHFVEHMAFNGTKNFPKQEIVSFLESLGMRFGARRQRVHQLRRDRLHAAGADRQARDRSTGRC